LNWLFLASLAPDQTETGRRTEFAQRCAAAARKSFRDEPNFWNAIIPVDAFLAESLLDGSLAGPAFGERIEQLVKQYRDAMTGVAVKPKALDSTVRQICLMALFFAVQGEIGTGRGEGASVARALKQLAEQLMPGSCDAAFAGAKASTESPRKRRSREPRKRK
jgi:hypothetical protein